MRALCEVFKKAVALRVDASGWVRDSASGFRLLAS